MGESEAGTRGIDAGERRTAWILLGAAGLLNAAGYAFGLWDRPFWFDEVVHAYTMFAITLVLALRLYDVTLTGAREHGLLLVLTIAAIGVGIGGLWEVAEWAYDQWMAEGDAILGKWDTMVDLIADTAGTLAAGALLLRMVRD